MTADANTLDLPVVSEGDHIPLPNAGTVYSWAGLQVSEPASPQDYPLTGNCHCGRWLIRLDPGVPWHPRGSEELIDAPSGTW